MTLNSTLPGKNVPKNASDTIQLSRLFFDELLAESETLTGIAEVNEIEH